MDPNSVLVDVVAYVDGRRSSLDAGIRDLRKAVESTDGFVWIGLRRPGPEDMAAVAAQLDLPALAVEDAVQAHQRPKLDAYADHLFAVLKPVDGDGGDLQASEIAVFVGPKYLVTVRHGDSAVLERVHRSWDADDGPRPTPTPAAVLHRIADTVVDEYEKMLDRIQTDVDAIEEKVFAGDDTDHAESIYQLKRQLAEMRRVVTPLVLPTQKLAAEAIDRIEAELRPYFRDVHDHVLRAADVIENADRLLSDVLQADQSRLAVRQNEIALKQNDVAVQQNEDMRKMSAWAAIALVPTAIAGVYGMNFDNMPELHWRYGYFLIVGVIVGVCVGLYALFRRNRWL